VRYRRGCNDRFAQGDLNFMVSAVATSSVLHMRDAAVAGSRGDASAGDRQRPRRAHAAEPSAPATGRIRTGQFWM